MQEKEGCRIEVKRISPNSYGVILYKEKDASLLDVVEAIPFDGHFSLSVRGNKPFETLDILKEGGLKLKLYNKAKEIASERLKQNYYCN